MLQNLGLVPDQAKLVNYNVDLWIFEVVAYFQMLPEFCVEVKISNADFQGRQALPNELIFWIFLGFLT